MDRACDQLLAGAVLALDQHGRVARRDALDQRIQLLHRRRCAEDPGEPRAPVVILGRLAFEQCERDIERGFVEHAVDQLDLWPGQRRPDHRETGTVGIVHGDRGKRTGFARAPFDQRELEPAPAQHAANVPKHAQIQALPPRRPHRHTSVTSSHTLVKSRSSRARDLRWQIDAPT